MIIYILMSGPEHHREIQISFGNTENNDIPFQERQFRAVLREMYQSGNYNSRYVPEKKTIEGKRIDAVHIVSFDPGDRVQLYEFIPGHTDIERVKLAKLLRQQLAAYDISDLIDDEIVNNVSKTLREEGLHVIGGFQLGTFDSGVRSVEIVFPELFAELTGSEKLAADISAAYIRLAQEMTS